MVPGKTGTRVHLQSGTLVPLWTGSILPVALE
jgi:hypothetical protein